MSELKSRTRSGSSTYGKPRVYLSFYDTDKDGAASELCDDILRINNCAVFFYEDGVIPADMETREAEMGQMQLFVLVCTPDYMSEKNTSRNAEIVFALGHGIPVLPVIPGDNVIDAFNALCAELGIESLHCLDRNEFAGNDEGYTDKLKEHLDYFLISDEDTERIKEQFRACIFLSYRKKDREYARALIRRIHALQKYYDIAVWYDDYLVPGRSFENEIFDAMDRSDLFILAVTPNIMALNAANEENYVVRKEYPEALKRGKKIVAAELEDTDRKTLLIKFDDLPECINAYDELALADSLSVLDMPDVSGIYGSDSKSEAADITAAGTAEHRYYIGLAYLNGISAEVDPAKAFELISSAADDRFEPAMDRLVRMYRSGIAVPRDHGKAIEWQQKLVDLAEERLQKEESAENAHNLFYRLGQLGKYLTEQRDDEAAYETYTKILQTADRFADRYPLAALYRDYSVVCNKLGDICLSKKDFEKAESLFESGWRAAGILKDEQADEAAVRDYAVSCQKLGEVNRLQGNFIKAKDYYAEAFGILNGIREERPTAANIRDVYITGAMLGDAAFELGDLDGAEEAYRNSLELRETVCGETGADWAKRDVSVIWEKLADLYAAAERSREASDAYEQAVYTANELFEKTRLPVHETELSKVCTKAGEFHLKAGQFDEASYYLEAALEMDEKLCDMFCTPQNLRDLSVTYNRLAMTFKDMGNNEQAKKYYYRDYCIARELAETSGDADSRRDYGLSCNYMGSVCAELGQMPQAMNYYEEGVSVLSPLADETQDPVHMDDLAVLYYNMFRSFSSNTQALLIAYSIWSKLHRQYPENETYRQRFELTQQIVSMLS